MTQRRDDRDQDGREQDDREDGNALEHDAALDRMLKVLPTPEPSAALRRAVAEIPLRHPKTAAPFAWPWISGGALAWGGAHAWRGALVAGVLVFAAGALSGVYGGSVVPEIAELDDDASDASEEPWQELSVLAFAAELDEELEP